MKVLNIILMIAAVLFVLLYLPSLVAWAINTLFNTTIEITLKTWAALWVLMLCTCGGGASGRGK